MRTLLFAPLLLILVLTAAPASGTAAQDLLTILYTGNTSGEYVPCPT